MQAIFETNEKLASCKIFIWQSNSGNLSTWIHDFRIYWVPCMGSSLHSVSSFETVCPQNRNCTASALQPADPLSIQWYLPFIRHENTSLKTKQGFYDCVNCGFRRSMKYKIKLMSLQHAHMIIFIFVNSQNAI